LLGIEDVKRRLEEWMPDSDEAVMGERRPSQFKDVMDWQLEGQIKVVTIYVKDGPGEPLGCPLWQSGAHSDRAGPNGQPLGSSG
jgi:hypothetical protein